VLWLAKPERLPKLIGTICYVERLVERGRERFLLGLYPKERSQRILFNRHFAPHPPSLTG
jgi:hypothetical protein